MGNTPDVIFFSEILDSSTYTVEGIIQHEFGHVLGLFHEHARFVQQDGVLDVDREFTCVISSGSSADWRGITPPAPDSIMGYPYCRGTPGGAETLSSFDRLGLRYLYNLPALTTRSLDDVGTDDIMWYTPTSGSLSVWYGEPSVMEPGFTETSFCWNASADLECAAPATQEWKPIPIRLDERASVLMYGPGSAPDRLFVMPAVPSEPDRFGVAIGLRTAVPRVGDLRGCPAEI